MAKIAKSVKKAVKPPDLDLDPDAWPKFEKLIKSAAKMGPKPHKTRGDDRGGRGNGRARKPVP